MEPNCTSLIFDFVLSSKNRALLFQIKSFIVSASLESCESIVCSLKSILKNKSQPFPSKLAALKVLQAGLDTLNVYFIHEVSRELSTRLKRLALYYGHTRISDEAEEFYSFLLFCLQNWAMRFGEIAEEITVFNQVYIELLDNRIPLPYYERDQVDFYLKDLIDLKAAVFLEKTELARKYYERVKRSKKQLQTEMLSKAGQGMDLNRLIDVDEKYHETIFMYKDFKRNYVVTQEMIGTVSAMKLRKYSDTEEPVPKEVPFVFNDSDSFSVHGETLELVTSPRELDEAEIEHTLNDELSGLNMDYCRLKDLLEHKEHEIREIAKDSEEQLQKLLIKYSNLRKKYKMMKGEIYRLTSALEEATKEVGALTTLSAEKKALEKELTKAKRTICLLDYENTQFQNDIKEISFAQINNKIDLTDTIELQKFELNTLATEISKIAE